MKRTGFGKRKIKKMTNKTTPLFNALALGSAVFLLAGCHDMSYQEQVEAIAPVLSNTPELRDKLIAFSRYEYRTGKSTTTVNNSALVSDIDGCKLHGQYEAAISYKLDRDTKIQLSCLNLKGGIVARMTCHVKNAQVQCWKAGEAPPEAPPANSPASSTFKYPSLY